MIWKYGYPALIPIEKFHLAAILKILKLVGQISVFEEGLKKTKYIGIVLSPRSIKSSWVERELDIAINREISTGEVAVLPLLYEKCDLPAFLKGKMYADFTSATDYDEGIQKILRRLKRS